MNIVPPQERDQTGTQSVDRALGLLSLIGRHAERGASLGEMVEESGLNKPTTRRLLLALIRAGLIAQDETTRRYYLGEEAYVLGSLATARFGLLQVSFDSLARLSKKTEDTSFLSIRRDSYSICLHREEGTYPVRTHVLQAGFEHPLGVGAGSLAMLAALSDAEVDAVIEANDFVMRTRFPMVSITRLRDDIAATRAAGFALNPGLIYASSWGIGVALHGPDGKLAGALSIAAIDSRLQPDRQRELAALLQKEARLIEGRLENMFASRQKARDPLTSKYQTRRPIA